MAEVTIDGTDLVVTIHGLRKVLALKSELRIPLVHVAGVSLDPTVEDELPSAMEKRAGADIPHLYYGGTFVQDGDRVFWDVRRPDRAIVIHLSDDELARLIVDVDDPDAVVARVQAALPPGATGTST